MAPSQDSREKSGWWIVPAVLVLLALYVLSIGPLAWLESKGHFPDDPDHPAMWAIIVVYYPVLLFSDTEWFQWYVGLWDVNG